MRKSIALFGLLTLLVCAAFALGSSTGKGERAGFAPMSSSTLPDGSVITSITISGTSGNGVKFHQIKDFSTGKVCYSASSAILNSTHSPVAIACL